MRSFPPLRVTAHICLVSALLCMISPFRENWQMFAALAGLMLVGVFVAVRVRQAWARLLLAVLPALALLLAANATCLIAGAALTIYGIVFVAANRMDMDVWKFRREAIWEIVLCSIIAMLSPWTIFHSPAARGFVVSCVFLLILALRALKMQRQSTIGWELGNLGLLAFPATGGAVVGAILWVIFPLIQRLTSLLAPIYVALLHVWNLLMDRLVEPLRNMEDASGENWTGEMPTTFEGYMESQARYTTPPTVIRLPKFDSLGKWIFAAIALTAIILLVVYLLRKGRRLKAPAVETEEFTIELDREDRGRKKRRKSRRGAMSNRLKIRTVYREYLVFLRRHGAWVKERDTTADISDVAASALHESDEQLRRLYRLARYGAAEPDDRAVEEARKALHRLTAGPEQEAEAQQ